MKIVVLAGTAALLLTTAWVLGYRYGVDQSDVFVREIIADISDSPIVLPVDDGWNCSLGKFKQHWFCTK